jgi:hypothetical protein
MLSQQAIMEYQKLYKQSFGKDVSYEEAADQGERLVSLVRIVLRPNKEYRLDLRKGGEKKYGNND